MELVHGLNICIRKICIFTDYIRCKPIMLLFNWSLAAPQKKEKKGKEPEAPILYEDPPDKTTSKDGHSANMKITSWNVDGLRAWVKKKGLDVSYQMAHATLALHYAKSYNICSFLHAVGTCGGSRCAVPARNKVC